jgi:hypothetical protein
MDHRGELGSVTLKRIGFFAFQLNTQHTHRTYRDVVHNVRSL